ncbi:MAG: hypothetical protein GWN84_26470 [Gammaproteobacteria bacterium]|nr:hypothetical protein [Gammaproteobacteria bacterium]NIR85944.1 hypothetical protein [Gammaproteobacteria bacterium]NIR91936.1 hypothetical protein [Gammaproteobacteria bacterium]NIU07193.1 hypothetical protein [Gammaproteobacteria bacterium]NIV54006.1 hypothetical protein [Gammaproteobacteria bacterium]
MVWIKHQDIQLAFEFVGSVHPYEHTAYVSLDTGEIFYVSDWIDLDETPDDLDTSDRYIEIPHKNELNLGQRLVREFVAARLPEYGREVERIFSRKGAYSRFKNLLESKGLLEEWYQHEDERSEAALRECSAHPTSPPAGLCD